MICQSSEVGRPPNTPAGSPPAWSTPREGQVLALGPQHARHCVYRSETPGEPPVGWAMTSRCFYSWHQA